MFFSYFSDKKTQKTAFFYPILRGCFGAISEFFWKRL